MRLFHRSIPPRAVLFFIDTITSSRLILLKDNEETSYLDVQLFVVFVVILGAREYMQLRGIYEYFQKSDVIRPTERYWST